MIPEEQKKALDSWQTSARYWDKYRALIAKIFAPLKSGLVDEARIKVGQRVLDIGGGTGEPALTISRIVGPTGSVMYTDPVAGMARRLRLKRPGGVSQTSISRNVLPMSCRLRTGRLMQP